MRFTIITHVLHYKEGQSYFAYAPYVREMNIWAKYVDELVIVAPTKLEKKSSISEQYQHQHITFITIDSFNILNLKNTWKTLFKIPKISHTIFRAMQDTDHIHLRCPGNVGLIAAFVQVLFPKKKKTVKYAGNWDPKSNQPWSYILQKKILQNTRLTRKCQVLVYGDWPKQSVNVLPFFTATYSENEKKALSKVYKSSIKFVFTGTLSEGKRPLYGIQLVEKLLANNLDVALDVYGDGILRRELETYISEKKLQNKIKICGNQPLETIKEALKNAHFSILPSKSEGWPKAIAEAMFWKVIPISTEVSCIPWMLNYEERGILLTMDLKKDVKKILNILNDKDRLSQMSDAAYQWSRKYTVERFSAEIKKLI